LAYTQEHQIFQDHWQRPNNQIWMERQTPSIKSNCG